MNTMIRYYSEGVEAIQKQAMSFRLNEFDLKSFHLVKNSENHFMPGCGYAFGGSA